MVDTFMSDFLLKVCLKNLFLKRWFLKRYRKRHSTKPATPEHVLCLLTFLNPAALRQQYRPLVEGQAVVGLYVKSSEKFLNALIYMADAIAADRDISPIKTPLKPVLLDNWLVDQDDIPIPLAVIMPATCRGRSFSTPSLTFPVN